MTTIEGVIVGAEFDAGTSDRTLIIHVEVPVETRVGFVPVSLVIKDGSGKDALAAMVAAPSPR